ncbi:sugar transferase [Aestuariibaculum sp. M13]|uniref:sugar transferase n=1 Tax=Aestuariibaculum sp. M13 TaxID=2967132 RepID=UPI00215A04F0|nr:sugar transferase [Aestuariibaculum sp. M13]MCR8667625.1 sugar transferase [Aestuariibaculum sp. M13]
MVIKRIFDIVFSFLSLVLFTPLLLLLALLIRLDSKGPVIFKQSRVGKMNKDFNIFKFRTMIVNSEDKNLLTLGNNDKRITKLGCILRKYKLDELPQLINVLIGDMSFVGPRPELRHYVNLYSQSDLEVLAVKPGVTGLASIKYRHEAELLKSAENPEKFYIHSIMPDKLKLNKEYIKKRSLLFDIKLLLQTFTKIIVE